MTREKRLNSRSTGRALLASFLALLLCFATLLGTTYAWFTDSATTGTNTIKAGNLDVDLLYQDGTEWKNADGVSEIFTQKSGDTSALIDLKDVLWEPGATYETTSMKVVNSGSLAATYTLKVTMANAYKADGTKIEDITDVFDISIGSDTDKWNSLADFNINHEKQTLYTSAQANADEKKE
jgi:predicted ribosomally synthesized peptide with SipW-like signal peptide